MIACSDILEKAGTFGSSSFVLFRWRIAAGSIHDDTIYRRSSISNNRSAVYRFVRISIQRFKLDRSYFRSIITIVTSQCKFQGNRPFFTFLASYAFEKSYFIFFSYCTMNRTLKINQDKLATHTHTYIYYYRNTLRRN